MIYLFSFHDQRNNHQLKDLAIIFMFTEMVDFIIMMLMMGVNDDDDYDDDEGLWKVKNYKHNVFELIM